MIKTVQTTRRGRPGGRRVAAWRWQAHRRPRPRLRKPSPCRRLRWRRQARSTPRPRRTGGPGEPDRRAGRLRAGDGRHARRDRRSPARTLGDLLATRPGISSSSFAPGAASRPVIRGLDNHRVRIQENGIGTHDVLARSARTMPSRSIRSPPGRSRWFADRRRCAGARRPSAAWSMSPTAAFRPQCRRAAWNLELLGGFSSVDRGLDGGIWADAGHGNVAIHADAFGRNATNYRIPSYPYLFPEDPAPAVRRPPTQFLRAIARPVARRLLLLRRRLRRRGHLLLPQPLWHPRPGERRGERAHRHAPDALHRQRRVPAAVLHASTRSASGWAAPTIITMNLAAHGGGEEIHQTFTNRAWEGRTEFQFLPYDLRLGEADLRLRHPGQTISG